MNWDALIRADVAPLTPYAPGLRGSEVRERTGADEIRKLSSNENPYGPVPQAIAGMRAVLPFLNRYPDGSSRALRRRIAEHLGVDERFVAVGNGSNELLRVIGEAILGPGDEAVFAWPSFVVYPMVCQLMGATAVKVPLAAGEVHDLDAMLAAINERTKIVFMCNPNNPTGTIYTREAFDRFIAAVPEHVLVVLDEAYFEYVTSPDYPNGLDYFDGVKPIVVLRTFSKMYSLAGLRVGYGVMPEAMVDAVNKVRDPFNVNTVAQVAAYYSLDAAVEVARRRAENARERDRLGEAFDRLGITWAPSETNFVYIASERSKELFDELLGHGIIVRDFGTAPALRVGVGTPEDTDATIAAFERVMAERGAL
ncbi:MAG TPA: histidinol-phosphate transaminase [Coriobacteriia bacterium]|nr:histidinol-phosphate transaminase [Coriobacteriia bacterium]